MIAFPDHLGSPETTDAPAAGGVLPLIPIPDDDEALGDEIARLAAHIHAATYHLLVLIKEIEVEVYTAADLQLERLVKQVETKTLFPVSVEISWLGGGGRLSHLIDPLLQPTQAGSDVVVAQC